MKKRKKIKILKRQLKMVGSAMALMVVMVERERRKTKPAGATDPDANPA